MDEIVIVGASLAGAKAAQSLRKQGFTGGLTLIGAEQHRPYERPPLSKEFLTGQSPIDDAYVFGADWFSEHDVQLRTAATATGLDLAAAQVALDSGEQLGFDVAVLAMGAEPRTLGIPGAEHAFVLRTIEDAEQLKKAFEAGPRVVTIGGGWIGLEVAAAARQAGLDVTVVEAASLPLQNALGERLARYVSDLHRSHGVQIRTDTQVEEILHDGDRCTGVRTAEGTLPADVVVLAVGAAPRVDLAEAAGLSTGNGIITDERLRTSDDRVFAIGDVASAYNTALGTRLRVEHWDNALRQGKLVGKTVLGQDAVYDWQPYFYTDQFEFAMEYVGHAAPDDRAEIRGDLDGNEFIAYWLDDGDRLTAAMNVGIWDVNDQLREMIGNVVDPGELTDLR